MSSEAAFHDGYRKAMEEISCLVREHSQSESLGDLAEEINRRIERARCLSAASAASQAGGNQGY